ncbi:MAG: hypothetical protein AB7P69_27950 [Candidatus Binatia bacterium]
MRKIVLAMCIGFALGNASQILSDQIKPDTGLPTTSPQLSPEERERLLQRTERQVEEPKPLSPEERERTPEQTEQQGEPKTKFTTPSGCSSSRN